MITLPITKTFINPFSHTVWADLLVRTKALIYARVSTDDQAKNGYSLDSQVERCVDKLIKQYGIKEDEIIALIEMGEMGDDPNRPALNYAKWLIEQGVGQKFAVLHPDRLARNFRQQVEFIEDQLLEHGLELVSVEVPFDPNNAESVLFFNMQAAIAQYNKAKILANSKRGRRQKVKNGKIPGVRRIYGYTFDKENDILAVNPEEREVYLLMVDWILHGKDGLEMNLTAVARELSLLGIPAPSGDKWYQATVSRILKNSVYVGRFYYGKTEYKQVKGKIHVIKKPEAAWQMVRVPAFINEEIYAQLQQKISSFSFAKRGAKPHAFYLMKGLLRCGRCHRAVVAGSPSRHKKTKEIIYHYYACSGKSRKVFKVGSGQSIHRCTGRNWRQDVIDHYVWTFLVRFMSDAMESTVEIDWNDVNSSERLRLNKKKKLLETAWTQKQKERKRWLDFGIKGRVTEDELDEVLRTIESESKKLQSSIAEIDTALALCSMDEQIENNTNKRITAFKKYLREQISNEEKRKFISLFIQCVVLHEDEIEIFLTCHFTNLNEKKDRNDMMDSYLFV